MKKTDLKILLLLFSFLALFSCHNEEEYQDYQSQEKTALLKSRELYNSAQIQDWLKSQKIDLQDKVLWDSALVYSKNSDGSIIIDIPIKRAESTVLEKLIFTVGKDIKGQLWTFRSENPFYKDFEQSYTLTAHDITKEFKGQLIMFSLNDKKFKIVDDLQYTTFDYPSMGSVCDRCHMSGGPINLDEVVITAPGSGDSGGGDGWDYDWGGVPQVPIPTIIIIPSNPGSGEDDAPDCESFKFQQVTSLWQEAAVKNIHFKIYLVSPQGVSLQYYISYPQAMSFGMPSNLVIGNTTITPGVAASISAQAVQAAMSQTVQLYGNTQASEMTVSNYFLNRLDSIFENMVPGGRFQSNYSSPGVTPSNYETNFFGTGNCD